jgi:hypothetical protein
MAFNQALVSQISMPIRRAGAHAALSLSSPPGRPAKIHDADNRFIPSGRSTTPAPG